MRTTGVAVALALVACSRGVAPFRGLDCGRYGLYQDDAQGYRCLADAWRTRTVARLTVTDPSLGGAPVTTTYTTRTDGFLEVRRDARRDPSDRTDNTSVCQVDSIAPSMSLRYCS